MAGYTPSTTFEFDGGGYTPSTTFDFRTATEIQAALNAALLPAPKSALLDAVLSAGVAVQSSLEAAINAALLYAPLDASVIKGHQYSVAVDSALIRAVSAQAAVQVAINAALLQSQFDASVFKAWSLAETLDALITQGRTVLAALDGALSREGRIRSAELSAAVQARQTLQASLQAATVFVRSATANLNASVVSSPTKTALLGAVLFGRRVSQAALDVATVFRRKFAVFPDSWVLGINTVERVARARLDANLLPGDDMSLSFSTGLRNHLLGNYARETGDGLGGAMHNCFVDIYVGDKPASPDFPPVYGTFLGTFQLSENPYSNEWGGAWAEPVNGSIGKEGWQTWRMQAAKSGVPGWFRMRLIDDLNDFSQTAHRIDGTIGQAFGSFDMVMKVAAVVQDRQYTLSEFTMTMRQEN